MAYGRDGQDTSKRDKPKGEIRRWVAASLFPEPVILTFLRGAMIGYFIVLAVAWNGVKE